MFKKRHGWKYNKIAHSSEFNPEWYLKTYPDIAQSGVDPVRHYLRVGWCEGRNPGPNFNTNDYLAANPDVASIGMCPLLHWERFGRAECRPLTPPITPPEVLSFTTTQEKVLLPTNKFDVIVPLGASCHASMMLRTANLQTMSYPLDWSASDKDANEDLGLTKRVDLICNNFCDFVNQSDLISRNIPNGKHLYVANARTGLHYLHDFPTSKTIAEEYDNFHDRYTRRAQRLMNDIKAAQNIAFVWVQDAWDQIHKNITRKDDLYWADIHRRLSERFVDKNIIIFAFEHNASLSKGQIIQTIINKSVFRFASNHTFIDDKTFPAKYSHDMVAGISAVFQGINKKKEMAIDNKYHAMTFTTDSEHLTLPTNKFDLFIPVGASCFATMHLRTMGLQKMSYPFDWSASEDDEHHDRGLFVRIGLLCNRFTDFLNASDMLDKNYPDRPEHRYVLNTRTGLHYVHDFPVSKTMAEEMPAFQEKYARRTSRLLSDIDAANNIALIWIQDVYEQIHSNIKYLPDEYWLEMYNKFASAYPGKNVSLFVFEHNPNAHDNEIQQTIIENRVFRFKSNHSILDENGWLESYKRFRVKNISAVLFQLKKQ